MDRIGILGCGWLGLPLGERLAAAGYSVHGTTTTPEKLSVLREKGVTPFHVDLSGSSIDPEFFDAPTIVVAIPPKLRKQTATEYLEQMDRASGFMSGVKHVIFVSSTSVYPDLNRVVYEDDADSSSPLVQAEEIFVARFPVVSVIRFAGLVGPGRHPGRFLSGKETDGTAPVNIIHLEDCIEIIQKLVVSKKSVVLNGCADAHPERKEFYSRTAEMLGVAPPKFVTGARADFKIVSNSRLKETLGYQFRFPDPMQMEF